MMSDAKPDGLPTDSAAALPSVSIVVPTHNVGTVLGDQLDALAHQTYEGKWDVVVVDNRSTDDTVQVARRYSNRLPMTIVEAPLRPSPAYARNVGVRESAGELIIFIDGDDVADRELVAAYACRADQYRAMGGALDHWSLNDPIVASWRFESTSSGLPITLERFPLIVTANCAIRRDVFDEIGYFDENLTRGGEDTDLAIRVTLASIEIGWVPEAIVHYRHRPSLNSLVKQQFGYGRSGVELYDRYRDAAGPRKSYRASIAQLARVLAGAPNLVRGRQRRGQWLRFSSFVAGHLVESIQRRTWYVG